MRFLVNFTTSPLNQDSLLYLWFKKYSRINKNQFRYFYFIFKYLCNEMSLKIAPAFLKGKTKEAPYLLDKTIYSN